MNGRYTQPAEICATPVHHLYSTRDDQLQQKDSGPPETADCALSALRRHRMDNGTSRGPEHDAWVRSAAILRKSAWSLHERVWGRVVWPCIGLLREHEEEKSIHERNDSLCRIGEGQPNQSLKASHIQNSWPQILDRRLATERIAFLPYLSALNATQRYAGQPGRARLNYFAPGFTLSLARASVPLLLLTYRCKTESAEPGPLPPCQWVCIIP